MRLQIKPSKHEPTLREKIIERLPIEQVAERLPVDRIAARLPFRRPPPPPSRLRRAAPLIGAGATGAVLAYFFDPDRGRSRRTKARDMIAGRMRRVARGAERKTRYLAGKASGVRERTAHELARDTFEQPLDDATLKDKVMSEVLGGSRFDKSRIVINVENGMVVLRGEADTPDDLKRLEKAVRKLPGVIDVENLMHIKGSPAVNKQDAIDSGRRR